VRKIVLLLILVAVASMGCVTQKNSNNLFKIPEVNTTSTPIIINATHVKMGVLGSNTTNEGVKISPPENWSRERLYAGCVGWGVGYIHPLIIITKDNATIKKYWLNRTVNSSRDVLRYIYKQKYVWVNGTTMFLNGTYFRIMKIMIIHGKNVSIVYTPLWKKWWRERGVKI